MNRCFIKVCFGGKDIDYLPLKLALKILSRNECINFYCCDSSQVHTILLFNSKVYTRLVAVILFVQNTEAQFYS